MRDSALFMPIKGNFRVVGVDTFDHTDWVDGDYETLAEARKVAKAKGGTMTVMYVYDKTGSFVFKAGTY